MRKIAVILAGGAGMRAGGNEPKQFRELCGKPMLYWSIKAFADEDRQTRIIVVLNPAFRDEWRGILGDYAKEFGMEINSVDGGKTRFHSVANALAALGQAEEGYVAVHDAARPLVDPALISRGWEAAREFQGAVPVLPMTDSMRKLDDAGSKAVSRGDYVRVQTPQIFDARRLIAAYSAGYRPEFTDDASVYEAAGFVTGLYDGDERNIKVTHPDDFAIAEVLLRRMREKNEEVR